MLDFLITVLCPAMLIVMSLLNLAVYLDIESTLYDEIHNSKMNIFGKIVCYILITLTTFPSTIFIFVCKFIVFLFTTKPKIPSKAKVKVKNVEKPIQNPYTNVETFINSTLEQKIYFTFTCTKCGNEYECQKDDLGVKYEVEEDFLECGGTVLGSFKSYYNIRLCCPKCQQENNGEVETRLE